MPTLSAWTDALDARRLDPTLASLYGPQSPVLDHQRQRWLDLIALFDRSYPYPDDIGLFSAPGRTEIGGNHTDHNGGRVLAAAVDLDTLAAAAPNTDQIVRIQSVGYSPIEIRLDDLSARSGERYQAAALVRGVCARLRDLGHQVGGFDALLQGDVPPGSGLSSSAAFEVLIAVIQNAIYNANRLPPVELARIGQYAENNFFGKPSGLMDQITSALGGFVTIDFRDPSNPLVEQVDFNFAAQGHRLMIVDTGGSHADLNADYASVEQEMKSVARAFGASSLRELPPETMYAALPSLRGQVSDRALLRAIHFYTEDLRVVDQVAALRAGDFTTFLRLVRASGASSWMLNQNTYSPARPTEQGIPLALALADRVLAGQGASRVHGGGFAGTIQVFVPEPSAPAFRAQMESLFGPHSCREIQVRPSGAQQISFP